MKYYWVTKRITIGLAVYETSKWSHLSRLVSNRVIQVRFTNTDHMKKLFPFLFHAVSSDIRDQQSSSLRHLGKTHVGISQTNSSVSKIVLIKKKSM